MKCEHEFVIYNYAEQAQRAAELMHIQDQKMAEVIEKMREEGCSLISIHYEF